MNLSKLWETVMNRGAWRAAVPGVTVSAKWVTEQQLPCHPPRTGKFRGLPGSGQGAPRKASWRRWALQPEVGGGCPATPLQVAALDGEQGSWDTGAHPCACRDRCSSHVERGCWGFSSSFPLLWEDFLKKPTKRKKKIVFKKEGWEEREGRRKREREKGRKNAAPSSLARLSFMLMSTSPQRQVVGKYCGSLWGRAAGPWVITVAYLFLREGKKKVQHPICFFFLNRWSWT